jgi:CRISPR-associated protein Cas1
MAASSTLPQENLFRKSPINRSGVFTLFGYGIKVRVQVGHLEIEDGIGPERRKFKLARVGHGLKRLVVIGSDGFISLAALRWLADQDVSFVMLHRDGSVLLTTGPVRPSDAKLRRAQALAHHSGAALRITRELISQKLSGQATVARNKLLHSATAETIAKYAAEINSANDIRSIRLIEAQAASAYWSAWRNLPINFPKNDARRLPQHWLSFGTRISPLSGSPRLSVNPPNAMLNYLYGVLETEARFAASTLGLDPGLGVLHADSGNRDSLALDLLEPIRPQVDAYLLDWITKEILRREWFVEERDGTCRLVRSFAVRLCETAQIWRRSVAPTAEWVAQAIWNSSQKRPNERQVIPTRLTHRRKSEGRGNTFSAPLVSLTRRARICEVCGAEGIKNRYCRSCAVDVARENMTEAALLGHSKPRSLHTKSRTKQKLSDHAVANTWWSPSKLPSWLTEQFYLQEILPRLKTIRVRQIAEAMHVSQAYAASIRAGRRPHPRHWQALAELVPLRHS